VIIGYSPGVRSHTRIPVARPELLSLPATAEPGALVEFIAADGTVLGTDRRIGGSCTWRRLPEAVSSALLALVRVTTSVRALRTGIHAIGFSGQGRFRLRLAGEIADARLSAPDGVDPTEAHIRPPQHSATVSLEAGQSVDVVLEHHVGDQAGQTSFVLGGISFQLNVEEPHLPDDDEIGHAVRLAQAADAVVIVVGTTAESESEGFDRATLDLPGRQDELVRRVAAANPYTVVIVNTGAPVLLPWADSVPAVMLTLFPGQEYGHALADVLLGRSEPGGRLPATWPESADDLPVVAPHDGKLPYAEGLHIGYRHFDRSGREPRYPFGHGLGYTRWDFLEAELVAPPSGHGPAADVIVHVRLRNSGTRDGCETIQVYASRPDNTLERPARWLAGFAKAAASAGAEVTADISIPLRVLAHWDTAACGWAIEPGDYLLSVGRSSRDLPLGVTLTSPGIRSFPQYGD
jgi:beta-glucosidase